METVAKLNLTRRWRSKTFDTIIGQDVSVRILKNSLFLNQVFPVYLFSGQRGCGKTTTARVFTAAVNCERLDEFRKNPRAQIIPCLECKSCLAMQASKHPDFTEIDAASHTGVDSIRQLIETTTFLPLMGTKKVYLIDEVHMLSKAAFNALLKILEEPPSSVIFILATTDPHNVIDTVKSRCFQLFFSPPEVNLLLKHLQNICKEEKIEVEDEALLILIRESEGSVRDAMNLLEQVRFIEPRITAAVVSRALGYVSDSSLLELIELSVTKNDILPSFLAKFDLQAKNADFVWKRTCELVKMLIYSKHGVESAIELGLKDDIVKIAKNLPLDLLIIFFTGLVRQELILLKTAHKSLSLELFFLQGMSNSVGGDFEKQGVDKTLDQQSDQKKNELAPSASSGPWQQMLGLISQCGDPVLISMFNQAKFCGLNQDGAIEISFSDRYAFFGELIGEKIDLWKKYLQQFFGEGVDLKVAFTEEADLAITPKIDSNNGINKEPSAPIRRIERYTKKGSTKLVDVSDKDKWPLVNRILENFPGQVYEGSE